MTPEPKLSTPMKWTIGAILALTAAIFVGTINIKPPSEVLK